MRILISLDPFLTVPPKTYGGIERAAHDVAVELVRKGHDVTVACISGSTTVGSHVYWPAPNPSSKTQHFRNAVALHRWVKSRRIEVVHSFSRLAYSIGPLLRGTPVVMTYQREIELRKLRLAAMLARIEPAFTCVGAHMVRGTDFEGSFTVVPNPVDCSKYEFTDSVPPESPLLFLGRIEEIKGTHLAIELAVRSGRKLVIAGNIPDYAQSYFDGQVRPHVDGDRIQYVGPVNDEQKSRLIASSSAFVMPILWEEPFGIVMIEALAGGTPVLALRRGAVPEIVVDGKTGYIRSTIDELIEVVPLLASLSRAACRADAELRYSPKSVAEAYLAVYTQAIQDSRR